MALAQAPPAARTFVPITSDSDVLRQQLAKFGLAHRELPRQTSRLAHELRLAGASVGREERREELRLHLQYWAAVRRLLFSSWDESPDIESFGTIRDLNPDELLGRAIGGAGLSQYEVRGFSVRSEQADRFLVYGCRLIEGEVDQLQASRVSFEETGIFWTKLLGLRADSFSAKFSGVISSAISGHMETADFSDAGMRDVDLEIEVSGMATFDGGDLSDEDDKDLEDNLRDVPHWREDQAGVRFVGCGFGTVTFFETKLAGATFVRCKFGGLRVDGADLRRSRFIECEVAGRPLSHEDLQGAAHGHFAIVAGSPLA